MNASTAVTCCPPYILFPTRSSSRYFSWRWDLDRNLSDTGGRDMCWRNSVRNGGASFRHALHLDHRLLGPADCSQPSIKAVKKILPKCVEKEVSDQNWTVLETFRMDSLRLGSIDALTSKPILALLSAGLASLQSASNS